MNDQPRRVLISGAFALAVGLTVVVMLQGGFSTNPLARWAEVLGVIACGVGVLSLAVSFVFVRMAGWREPEGEEEFERIVRRAERLAREGLAAEPDESEFMDLDPYDDEDFAELVRDALDDLPDLLREAIQNHNVVVVISDGGRRQKAYGLYHGDGMARDDAPDRIVIFRDTLRRDFGHHADLLRDQVVRTVRHELAHHIGFNEFDVRELGL